MSAQHFTPKDSVDTVENSIHSVTTSSPIVDRAAKSVKRGLDETSANAKDNHESPKVGFLSLG